jgi:chemotaxis protein CheD
MGVTIYDPVCGLGGVINFLLPDSTRVNGVDPAKAPFMFADTGVPAFIEALQQQGARPDRFKVVIAGGAHVLDQTKAFDIGAKNLEALKNCLKNFAIKVHHENIGGTNSRTLSLEIGSGRSSIKIFGEGEQRV